jgi:TPR repeat protein
MSTAKAPALAPAPPETLVRDAELQKAMRSHITNVILARVSQDETRRAEALRDYLALTQAAEDLAAAETLSAMVPPLMPSLYRRWAGMFAGRLFETASEEQLRVLCDGSEENGAALALAFVMFLESERMEKQMSEDLCAFGQAAQGEEGVSARMADVAASYIRARVGVLAGRDKETGSATAATAKKAKKARKSN